MQSIQEQNKAIVRRFNKECIEEGSIQSFHELLSHDVVNHTAPQNVPQGPTGFIYFLNDVLRTAFPDLKVTIYDQIAEGDLVTTRKKLSGTHLGDFLGIASTGKKVEINVIDIIKIRDGKYSDHWGQSNLHEVIAALRNSSN